MASRGIRDQIAIIGMGCTAFGEHWSKSTDDLLIDGAMSAVTSAGIEIDQIDAFWLGSSGSVKSGLALSEPLKLDYKPVTRIENMCATGSEAFRNACYAVASGAYDTAMAIGVEKLKDSGFSGLVGAPPAHDGTASTLTPPAAFSLRLLRRFRRSCCCDHLPSRGRSPLHRQAALREGSLVRLGSGHGPDGS